MFAHGAAGRRDVVFDEEPEAVSVEFVSGGYFRCWVFRVCRSKLDPEIDRNPTPVAVISQTRRFALDRLRLERRSAGTADV
jgi:hypothetical protein